MKQDVKTQVASFMKLSRSERREQYDSLDREVKYKAREAVEKQRGISHRTPGGSMVFTKERYIADILKLTNKVEVILPQTVKNAKAKIVELKAQLKDNYGDEAVAELDSQLKA